MNQQLDLCIPVEGEPAPECVWKFNGSEIKTADNVKVSYGTNVAKLLLIPARRTNVGKYTLCAKNKHGEDEVEVEVQIFGKPTVPVGPLKVRAVNEPPQGFAVPLLGPSPCRKRRLVLSH